MVALKKEIKELRREREEFIKQLSLMSEEIRQLRVDSESHSSLLSCLTEKLTLSLSEKQGENLDKSPDSCPLRCVLNEQTETPLPSQTPASPTTSSPTQIILLMDSNGNFVEEKKLFLHHRTKKLWCPNTKKALDLLSVEQLGNPSHIIIHTETNDLRTEQERVALSLKNVMEKASSNFPEAIVMEKASSNFPEARVVISTLLPRTDFHPDTINRINASISRDCAMKQNVFLAHHPLLNHNNLLDHVHLHKEAVPSFAKTLKDVALNRTIQRTSLPHHHQTGHPVHHQHQRHWGNSTVRDLLNMAIPQADKSIQHPKDQLLPNSTVQPGTGSAELHSEPEPELRSSCQRSISPPYNHSSPHYRPIHILPITTPIYRTERHPTNAQPSMLSSHGSVLQDFQLLFGEDISSQFMEVGNFSPEIVKGSKNLTKTPMLDS
ncbi:uncharacterized protein LOC125300506 [Alosa alosa]|uniref:uncharacterized protein LOC125300506 n=1 Tax=Alosa alosa TaxID=278164 RepID=UPI0020154629|nr:uncharacterized protein LOC125300506 [Alosa alosa]